MLGMHQATWNDSPEQFHRQTMWIFQLHETICHFLCPNCRYVGSSHSFENRFGCEANQTQTGLLLISDPSQYSGTDMSPCEFTIESSPTFPCTITQEVFTDFLWPTPGSLEGPLCEPCSPLRDRWSSTCWLWRHAEGCLAGGWRGNQLPCYFTIHQTHHFLGS